MPNLIETIKQVAMAVYKESKPLAIVYGIVESEEPLKVRVEQKLPLDESFLILSSLVKDKTVDITINGVKQSCVVHNKLKQNEKIMLLRVQGGQQYLVLDRV